MSASFRNLEHAAQVQFVRAEKAEHKAEDIHHTLNLMLNLGFERFLAALTMDGAVHEFELGIVRNLPASDVIDAQGTLKRTPVGGLCSGEPCSPEGTNMHRHSKMSSSDPCRSTSSPGVSLEISSKPRLRKSRLAGHYWSKAGLPGINSGQATV
jgi:hypothetical protein